MNTISERIAALQNQINRLQAENAKKQYDKQLEALPGMFGVKSLREVLGIVQKNMKNHRVILAKEVKDEIREVLKKNNSWGASVKLAQQYGVSVGVVQNLKEEMGLIKKRGPYSYKGSPASVPSNNVQVPVAMTA